MPTSPRTHTLTPTALVAFTECAHSTTLNLAYDARGEKRPRASGEFFDLITRKGREHEAAYRASLEAAGRVITEIPEIHLDAERAAAETVAAMQRGDDVIFQACLTLPGWRGAADFLERVEVPSSLGAWSYEPVDTKLARREALPHHVLQLAYYAEAIAQLQGSLPEHVHVELGSGMRESVRTGEIIDYARRQKARFEGFIEAPTATIAYPNAHCTICSHRVACEQAWRDEDHPSFVASIRRNHVFDLAAASPPVTTLSGLANLPAGTSIPGIKEHAFDEIRRQAQLQLETQAGETIAWEHREREPERGFDLLPPPSDGDIYLDLEGDPVWRADRSLVFLFGWIERGADGAWTYREEWAHDEAAERAAYDRLVAYIRARRAEHTDMHVYHYSHAETSMLSGIVKPDIEELEAFDGLVASRVFVDLYKVVRQGLRVGLEGYGLKRVEKLAGFTRSADVDGGSDAVVLYETWLQTRDDALLRQIAAYNEEDCRATLAVDEWLRDNLPTGEMRPRQEYEKDQKALDRDAAFEAREQIAAQLRERFPDDPAARLVGSLLNYYEREDRVKRRELTEMRNLPTPERRDDSRIIDGLQYLGEDADGLAEYTWDDQDHKIELGSVCDLDGLGLRFVNVKKFDDRKRLASISFKKGDEEGHPVSIGPYKSINVTAKQQALDAVANAMLSGTERFGCALGIARRDLPLVHGVAGDIHADQPTDAAEQDAWLDAVCDRALGLSGGPLSIQGPPGTGKTWLAGQVIVRLLAAGHTVAVTAPSHNAIVNACKQITDVAVKRGFAFRGARFYSDEKEVVGLAPFIEEIKGNGKAAATLADGAQLIAGTAWMCANQDLFEQVDYLIIDEAGQFGLADAVASAVCAKKGVLLVGDPLQLPQVAQARHEENGGCSVLEHILGEDSLIPDDRGILLTVTRRMHPDVCTFISDHVYESRLTALPELANQTTAIGTGIRSISAKHAGRSARSPEEAVIVRERAAELIGTQWIDAKGVAHEVTAEDIMVVAPYNAHVRTIRDELREDPRTADIKVGTVDKFQGGEAPIVFFSMATSSDEDLPRDKEFLFSRNRLNVAISRAQCVALLVANPELLNTRATTIEQMKLVSTLCAAWSVDAES